MLKKRENYHSKQRQKDKNKNQPNQFDHAVYAPSLNRRKKKKKQTIR